MYSRSRNKLYGMYSECVKQESFSLFSDKFPRFAHSSESIGRKEMIGRHCEEWSGDEKVRSDAVKEEP